MLCETLAQALVGAVMLTCDVTVMRPQCSLPRTAERENMGSEVGHCLVPQCAGTSDADVSQLVAHRPGCDARTRNSGRQLHRHSRRSLPVKEREQSFLLGCRQVCERGPTIGYNTVEQLRVT